MKKGTKRNRRVMVISEVFTSLPINVIKKVKTICLGTCTVPLKSIKAYNIGSPMHQTTKLLHAGCGGELITSVNKMYSYVTDSGKTEYHPMLYCKRCYREILGDAEIILITKDCVILS